MSSRILFLVLTLLSGSTAAHSLSGISLYGDLLYWKGSCAHLELESFESEPFRVAIHSQSQKIPPSYGYRVGANYAWCFDMLVLDANWTHFRTDDQTVNETKNEWKIDLAEASLAYSVYQYWCFYFDVLLGVEGGRIVKQHCGEAIVETNCFTGAGPLLGAALFWDWCGGFGFEGKGAISCLYGSSDFRFSMVRVHPLNDFCHEHHFMGISDVTLGLRWWVPEFSWYQVGFWLGWEHHAFLGNHRSDQRSLHFEGGSGVDYTFAGYNRTLILHGLTFSVDVTF